MCLFIISSPGVMENGLGYEVVKAINPKMVYAEISGYGKRGHGKITGAGTLLLQSMTGLAFTTGNGTNGPVPLVFLVLQIFYARTISAGYFRCTDTEAKTGTGALIEVSLMESLLDFSV